MSEVRELVGRSAEIARVESWLDSGEPLLTLTGAPGVGKTALALYVARRAAAREKRVIAIDVSSANSVEALASAILDALGMPRSEDESLAAGARRLSTALAAKPCLLVLDNFEQLLPAGSELIAQTIEQAFGLTVLITSRERLRIADERVLELGPLALDASHAEQSPAVELFLSRADRAGVAIAAEELGDVAELTRLLDGLPLAIELAAARTPLLRPKQLLLDCARPLAVLGTKTRTLQRAIADSWEGLSSDEQRALMGCAAFRSSFTSEAAREIVAACVPHRRDSLDLVQSLREKSLLAVDPFDSARLRVLFVIRAFVEQKKSEIDVAGEIVERHARWAASLARRGELISAEYEDLEAALDFFLRADASDADVERALEILLALCRLDRVSNMRVKLRARLDHALMLAGARAVSAELRCRLQIERAFRHQLAGALSPAEEDCRKALAQATELGLEREQGRALRILAATLLARGELDAALALAGEALEIGTQIGDFRIVGWAHDELGLIHQRRGDPARARRHAEEALAIFRRERDELEQIPVLVSLTFIHIEAGDLELARLVGRAGLDLFERVRVSSSGLSLILEFALARTDHAAGDLDAAQQGFAKCARIAEALGDPRMTALSQAGSALVWLEQGDVHGACLELRHALAMVDNGERDEYIAFARAVLAAVENTLGHRDACALELRSALAAFHDRPDAPLARAVRAVERLTLGRDDEARQLLHGSTGLFELRLIERLVPLLSKPASAPAPLRMLLAEDGSWFMTPAHERFACGTRPVLRRLLLGLAKRHLEARGAALDQASLVEIGWPGERMLASSAKRRLEVMISRMRELGLRGVLETTPTGYRLAPMVELSLTPP